MRELFIAICPCTLICLVVIGIKRRSPVVYHYMIEVPGGYKVNWPRAVKFAWELLLDSPLFLFLVGEWIVVDKGSIRNDARIAWLLALLAVGIPFGAVAHAKVGGWSNNLLPAFLGMTAFSGCPGTLSRRFDNHEASNRSRMALGSFLAILVMMTTFPHLTYDHNLLYPSLRRIKDTGPPWRSRAGTLPGLVVCPEDPTIPLYGKGFAGRNLFTEKDALPTNGLWPTFTPQPVLDELRSADYVIDVTNYERKDVEDGLLVRWDSSR